MWPFPDSRHLYLLIAGLVLGVILSPAVLGRLAPDLWQSAFSVPTLHEAVDAFSLQTNDELDRLAASGASKTHVEEVLTQRHAQQLALEERLVTEAAFTRMLPLLLALGLTLGAVMILETVMAPAKPDASQAETSGGGRYEVRPAVGRLVTVRYVLLAVGIALMLAQPMLWSAVPLVFTLLLLTGALGMGLVPLGARRAKERGR